MVITGKAIAVPELVFTLPEIVPSWANNTVTHRQASTAAQSFLDNILYYLKGLGRKGAHPVKNTLPVTGKGFTISEIKQQQPSVKTSIRLQKKQLIQYLTTTLFYFAEKDTD
jgi:hypothetical protein